MKCPFCGAEMEQGALQSTHGVYWVNRPAKLRPPQWRKEAEGLCDADNYLQSPYVPAHRCTTCRKIIVDYERNP